MLHLPEHRQVERQRRRRPRKRSRGGLRLLSISPSRAARLARLLLDILNLLVRGARAQASGQMWLPLSHECIPLVLGMEVGHKAVGYAEYRRMMQIRYR